MIQTMPGIQRANVHGTDVGNTVIKLQEMLACDDNGDPNANAEARDNTNYNDTPHVNPNYTYTDRAHANDNNNNHAYNTIQ